MADFLHTPEQLALRHKIAGALAEKWQLTDAGKVFHNTYAIIDDLRDVSPEFDELFHPKPPGTEIDLGPPLPTSLVGAHNVNNRLTQLERRADVQEHELAGLRALFQAHTHAFRQDDHWRDDETSEPIVDRCPNCKNGIENYTLAEGVRCGACLYFWDPREEAGES